ncbi:MAG: chorismate mutase [bacterium]
MTDKMTDKVINSAPLVAPAECTTMKEVRAGVDALDVELVTLLKERQGYMEAAARIKPGYEDVVVPWRIEEVIANVLREARKTGLSERIAEPVWRLLIEKCIEHEQMAFLERKRLSEISK